MKWFVCLLIANLIVACRDASSVRPPILNKNVVFSDDPLRNGSIDGSGEIPTPITQVPGGTRVRELDRFTQIPYGLEKNKFLAEYSKNFLKVGERIFVAERIIQSSTDEGKTWSLVSLPENAPDVSIDCLAGNKSVIMICLETSAYISNDLGASWHIIGPNVGVDSGILLLSTVSDQTVVVLTANGLFYSDNSGKNFKKSPGNFDDVVSLEPTALRVTAEAWYLFGTGKVSKSRDLGKTWETVWSVPVSSETITAFDIQGKNLAVGTTKTVYLSKDGGVVMSPVVVRSTEEASSVDIISVDGSIVVMSAGEYQLVSKDFGTTWSNVKFPETWSKASARSISVADGVYYLAAYRSDLYKSKELSSDFSPLGTVQVNLTHSVKLSSSDGKTIIAGSRRGLVSEKFGDQGSAVEINLPDIETVAIKQTLSDGGLFHVSTREGHFASLDGGVVWQQIHFSGRSLDLDIRDVVSLRSGSIQIGTVNGMFQGSVNDAVGRWVPVSDGLPHRSILSMSSGDKVVLVGTEAGLAVSLNAGLSYATVAGALSNPSSPVRAVHTDGISSCAVADGEVLFSSDSALSWSKLEMPVEDKFVSCIASKNIVVVASEKTLAVSLDSGHSWAVDTESWKKNKLESLKVDGDHLFLLGSSGVKRINFDLLKEVAK